jgi:hypothetical protein
VDVKQVGRQLDARYVLEGSVRKAGNHVRITGQLIQALTGGHLWADHFDGAIDDMFDLKDQVTASVVSAIAPKVEKAETREQRLSGITRSCAILPVGLHHGALLNAKGGSHEANADDWRWRPSVSRRTRYHLGNGGLRQIGPRIWRSGAHSRCRTAGRLRPL